MPFYTGKTADGSDAIQTGVYLSPDGNQWSNMPYTKEQIEHDKLIRRHWRVYDHISKHQRTLREEYHLILQRKSTLPKAERNYVIDSMLQEN